MEVFGKDLILGEFRFSDYGIMLSSFDFKGESEDEIGYTISTIEEFIGDNPIPFYLGDKHSNKIKPKITVVKDTCTSFNSDIFLSEKECRNILRGMTGIRGYQWMKIINDDSEDDIWFRAKIVNISSKRIGDKIAGLILDMECDAPFGWSSETLINLEFKKGQSIKIYSNTDDLRNYIYPVVSFEFKESGSFTLTNLTDNRISKIENVKVNERITIDSKNEVISSYFPGSNPTAPIEHELLLNDFNLNWVRLKPDTNELVTNMDVKVTFKYRVPRKVVLK